MFGKEFSARNRYVDIIPDYKTRVRLIKGVNKALDDYINACYVNSPFAAFD